MGTDVGEWDLHKLQVFVPDFAEKIQFIRPSISGAPDKLVWLGTKNGEYSTKSGYYAAVDCENFFEVGPTGTDFNWKKNVWELDVSPKIKTFAWKLLKGALPVGERLADRHIPIDPTCKRCGASESITHLFFQCQYSRKVWRLAPFVSTVEISGILDLVSSWTPLCFNQCLPPSGLTGKSLAPWIMWSLWKARNRFLFEGFSISPEDTLSTAISMAREWESQVTKETPLKRRIPIQPRIPAGTTVIRSDASWTPGGTMAGLGWATFSNDGIETANKRVSFVASALMAEGLALLEAVRTGHRDGLQSVVFESDSAQIIKAINSRSTLPDLYGVLADIVSLVASFDSVYFVWISRERNALADKLAKSALLFENPVVDEVFMASN
ncbi:hypothetical protein Bca101_016272 [Brassica carinata]